MPAARFNSSRSRNVTLTLAVLATLHFAFSSYLWALLLTAGVRQDWKMAPVVLGSLPAFLFLLWFAVTSLVALRRLRISAWLIAVGLIAAVAVFTYDAATRNYQLHWESYHSSGHQQTFQYSTWWWYDESWFRG